MPFWGDSKFWLKTKVSNATTFINRATTANEDRYLILMALRHQNMTITHLQQEIHSASRTRVSTQTVRNRLHAVGLYVRKPRICATLIGRHHGVLWELTIEQINCRWNEWCNISFFDEPRFLAYPDNNRIFILIERGIERILRSYKEVSYLVVRDWLCIYCHQC